MKGSSVIFLAAALGTACGCSIIEDNINSGRPRSFSQRAGGGRDSLEAVAENSRNGGTATPDTFIYCSAVRCPEGYDWRWDTACSNAQCEILLYRNGVETVCVPAGKGRGVSGAPDMHHIIDGELYTEYSSSDKTVITRGGDETVSFKGREMLKGLVNTEGHCYTLSQERAGSGFSFREDGKVILQKDRGTVFGGFADPSYPQTGALYEDESHMYFCYKEVGAFTRYFLVTDGIETEIDFQEGADILDMKVLNGQVAVASRMSYGFTWEDARVWDGAVSGTISSRCSLYEVSKGSVKTLCADEACVYYGKGLGAAVYCSSGGETALYFSDGSCRFFPDRYYFFTPACAAPAGSDLLLGLTPRERGKEPLLTLGSKEYHLENLGNGFITGVSVEISLPN